VPLIAGEVISYIDMCREEQASLQRGMNFRLHTSHSVILMSLRPGAPYSDAVVDNGKALEYEGHDIPRMPGGPDPKTVDQPMKSPTGSLTQNGQFYAAALAAKAAKAPPERVRVYEKIRAGIWAYAGLFHLVDAWLEDRSGRQVFKFRLQVVDDPSLPLPVREAEPEHTRLIPSLVKLEVWKRDKGKCVKCGSVDNLHFDHDIPYSKGGSSLTAANIQLMCARHNLAKRDRVE
jgi:HNH endonuclease